VASARGFSHVRGVIPPLPLMKSGYVESAMLVQQGGMVVCARGSATWSTGLDFWSAALESKAFKCLLWARLDCRTIAL